MAELQGWRKPNCPGVGVPNTILALLNGDAALSLFHSEALGGAFDLAGRRRQFE
jgi:hypothetical protein